ncbi:MAG: gamma-glutamylcyclotransferase family protein [Cyclobacteriaceae bacterium]
MNLESTYAFYGSLRRGMRYYEEFKYGLKYHHSFWLKGYNLYSLGPYPCAVKSDNPNNKILVEVMKLDDPKVEKKIVRIEMDAGYYYTDILIQNKPVGIFLYERAANYPQVHHGDWVKFFGS